MPSPVVQVIGSSVRVSGNVTQAGQTVRVVIKQGTTVISDESQTFPQPTSNAQKDYPLSAGSYTLVVTWGTGANDSAEFPVTVP